MPRLDFSVKEQTFKLTVDENCFVASPVPVVLVRPRETELCDSSIIGLVQMLVTGDEAVRSGADP